MKQWQLPEEQWMRYYKPDLEKAKKLMAEAGQAKGFTVKLGVIPTFPTMVSGAPVVAAHLKRIGINAEIENVEYAVWIKRWLAKDFDMTMNTTPGYADPDTAFLRLKTSDVDAVILDLRLGSRSGLEVLEQIRLEDRYAHLPVVILTGVLQVEPAEEEIIQRHGAHLLYKHYGYREVVGRLEQIIKTKIAA